MEGERTPSPKKEGDGAVGEAEGPASLSGLIQGHPSFSSPHIYPQSPSFGKCVDLSGLSA